MRRPRLPKNPFKQDRTILRIGVILSLVLFSAVAVAQVPFGFGGGRRAAVLRGMPDEPGGFVFCRLMFTTVRNDGSGAAWDIEYPRAEQNLLLRLSQLTLTPIAKWRNGTPGHTVVLATDDELFQCPFLMMAAPGSVGFDDAEAEGLREYLLKGGFLWADDFWGNASWAHWEREIGRVLPGYAIDDIPATHPIFDTYYTLEELPQIPALNFWRPGMSTSEMGAESETPHMRGIFDEGGRLLVLMTHNTDIADGWEREADLESYFILFAAKAYAVGVNVAIWSMTR
jgi:hypothetical protein